MRRLLVSVVTSVALLSVPTGTAHADTAAVLQPVSPPPSAKRPPAARPRRKGFIIAGAVTFGASYTLSALLALSTLGGSSCTSPCNFQSNTESRDLLIPVVGPWAAMSPAPSRDRGILAFLGLAQATGVVLTIAGIVRYAADGAPRAEAGAANSARQQTSHSGPLITCGVLPTKDGAFGFLSGRM